MVIAGETEDYWLVDFLDEKMECPMGRWSDVVLLFGHHGLGVLALLDIGSKRRAASGGGHGDGVGGSEIVRL